MSIVFSLRYNKSKGFSYLFGLQGFKSSLPTSIQFHENSGLFNDDVTVSILYGMKVQLCVCLQLSIPTKQSNTAHQFSIVNLH